MILTEEKYKEIKGKMFYVSPSKIKPKDCNTPKHIKYNMEHKSPDTPAKRFGRAFHEFLLEPEKFDKDYALLKLSLFGDNPKLNKDGSINKVDAFNKSILADFTAKNEGKIVLDFDDAESLIKCKESIMSLEDIHTIFRPSHAYVEATFLAFAQFDENHNFIHIIDMDVDKFLSMMEHEKIRFLPLLTRIDYGDKIGRWLSDLKTVDSIDPKDFSRDCEKYGYHIQVAMELDVVNAALGLPDEKKYNTFYFICVENHEPFDSIYFMPTSMGEDDVRMKFIEAGRIDYITKLEWVQEARITGKWEGISKFSPYKVHKEDGTLIKNRQIIEIDLPAWYYKSNLNLL